MKRYDVIFTIIIELEAEDKDEARDSAIVEVEENFLHEYITDTIIHEVKTGSKKA